MRNIIFAIVCMVILFQQAFATVKPIELSSQFKAASPYGTAALRKFIFHAYDAEIWTDSKTWSYEVPFALTLTYRMSFTTEELVDKTFEEMVRIHNISQPKIQVYKTNLEIAFPNVKDGDRITALYMPKSGVTFFYNGKQTQKIKSQDFSKQFLDIWLSEETSEPKLREQLLNLGS